MNAKNWTNHLSDERIRHDHRRKFAWLPTTIIVLLISFGFGSSPLLAQESDAASVSETGVDASSITADQVNEIARELWCPLCSGVRLDSCELKACDQMKDEIAIKLASGDGLPEIKAYFIDQYGPQVLGEPPREGFNLLAWILPFVVLIGGGVFLFTRGRKIFRNDVPMENADPSSADKPDVNDEKPTEDPYAQQLEDELKQYD